jgi:hemoglobin
MQNTPYDMIGGEAKVRELVDRFYDYMDELPEAYRIRKLHPADLSGSRNKLFMFLSGWLGGPQLYVQEYGHPRLRARHLPFPIGQEERDQWLMCMQKAMDDMDLPAELKTHLEQAFLKTADHMRNTDYDPFFQNK